MPEHSHPALLPPGLFDVLAPEAGHEARIVEHLMAVFAAHGYDRVKPPLIEFEDSLLYGAGAAMAKQIFRLMDPASQRMMGMRADMTPQVGRIAAVRLRNAARPLRLSYAGQVLRVAGSQLRPERQFGQVGVELIGAEQAAADAETVLLAAEALQAVGVAELTIDLTVPTLVPTLCAAHGVDFHEHTALRQALERKDNAAVAALSGAAPALIAQLMAAAGPAADAIVKLMALPLPDAAAADRQRLADVAALVVTAAPEVALTIDPVERRGFEYQTGVSFTLFARHGGGELGRGGRYRAGDPGETATGFSLYMDTLLGLIPPPASPRRLFTPFGTMPAIAAALRGQGWITVAGLNSAADAEAEARRLGCTHICRDGQAKLLGV